MAAASAVPSSAAVVVRRIMMVLVLGRWCGAGGKGGRTVAVGRFDAGGSRRVPARILLTNRSRGAMNLMAVFNRPASSMVVVLR